VAITLSSNQSDAQDRAEAAFEKVWNNFHLDKARLRNLSEKDKGELKTLMKTVFMSSMAFSESPKEIRFAIEGQTDGTKVEDSVRKAVQEELGGIRGMLAEIMDKPTVVQVSGGAGTVDNTRLAETASVVLHQALFDSDMTTNIDDIAVDGASVGSVDKNLEALRRLKNG